MALLDDARTIKEGRVKQANEGDRVLALRVMPKGPVYWLDQLGKVRAPAKYISVGTSRSCEIVVKDERGMRGKVHCFLLCDGDKVTVRHHHAKPMINNVAVVDGAELRQGNVLIVGKTWFVACGENLDQKPDITAPDIADYVHQAFAYHGSYAKAGKAIKIEARTFENWVKVKYAASAAVLCLGLAAGGWYWGMRETSGPLSSPESPLPAASAIQRPESPSEAVETKLRPEEPAPTDAVLEPEEATSTTPRKKRDKASKRTHSTRKRDGVKGEETRPDETERDEEPAVAERRQRPLGGSHSFHREEPLGGSHDVKSAEGREGSDASE